MSLSLCSLAIMCLFSINYAVCCVRTKTRNHTSSYIAESLNRSSKSTIYTYSCSYRCGVTPIPYIQFNLMCKNYNRIRFRMRCIRFELRICYFQYTGGINWHDHGATRCKHRNAFVCRRLLGICWACVQLCMRWCASVIRSIFFVLLTI